MKDLFEKAVSAVLATAAVAFAVAVLHREFFPAPRRIDLAAKSEYIPAWKDMIAAGRRVGSLRAPVTIVEFADLECPYCREFNQTIRTTLQKFPDDVAYVFIHFPLNIHRFAQPAARAAECAGDQGRFTAMVDLLFLKQDSLGLKRWASFASDAGVRDTLSFERCVEKAGAVPSIEAAISYGQKLNVHATPTVIVNGWRYGSAPRDSELVRVIADLLAGRQPYPDFPKTDVVRNLGGK